MSELAGISQGVTTVPLYDTLGPDAAEFVINQTELTTIACAGSYVPSLLMLKKAGRTPNLKNLIIFDKIDDLECGAECDLKIYEFQELIKMETGISAEQMPNKPLADDIYMLCYTSGTTGDPKAAKLTHKNLLSVATSANYAGVVFEHTDTMISYLPLAHSFEKVLFALCLVKGVRIGYYSGNVLKITDDCAVLQPTLFPSVPRLYNRIFDKINARLEELTGVRSYLANRAVNSKLYYLKEQGTLDYAFYDRAVCSKFRAILGGKVRFMVTGSAPISTDVLNFLKVCFCCPVLEGYGQTECSAACTIQLPEDPVAGHVGGPLPCIKLRLADLPELDYLSSDKPNPRGEVCLQGPSVFSGYYKNEEKTAEALRDGWLHTGDVGELMPNGCIKIIDRAKNIFKLQQGEYIAPEKLENVYCQSPWVSQIYVHGDSLQSYLVAVVVPDFDTIALW